MTFPERHNPQRLTHEEIQKLKRPLTNKAIESEIKTLPTMKSPGPDRQFHWGIPPNI